MHQPVSALGTARKVDKSNYCVREDEPYMIPNDRGKNPDFLASTTYK